MTDQGAKRHFTDAASRYSELRDSGPLGWMRSQEQAALRNIADIESGSTVLDAGCGDGATLEWLRDVGAFAVGIDFTWPMTRICAMRGHSVAVQDMEALGLRPVFDRVLCVGSLEFVPDPAQALKNLAACLAPTGTLVLLYPRKGPLGTLYSFYHRTHGTRIHLFNTGDITELFSGAGLLPPQRRRDCLLSSVCSTAPAGETHR